jgi:pyrophosphate--fructose-6-phosphate 1-phosphotransferase
VEALHISPKQIVDDIVALLVTRAENKMNYGVALIPEGLIEFIPEIKVLIQELNDLLSPEKFGAEFEALADMDAKIAFMLGKLTPASAALLDSFPALIKAQLLGDRDPHGNVQVSRIETEKLLITMVEAKLKQIKAETGKAIKFSTQTHFFGYEGRCAAPSNFDADYCYSLGFTAASLIGAGKTGYMSSVRNISAPAAQWEAGGIPLTMMMNMEHRNGKDVPVIRKALVELDKKPFLTFAANREAWGIGQNLYVYPGPIQYFGPSAVCDRVTITLTLEHA